MWLRLLRILDTVLTCLRGVSWALLLVVVAFAYDRAGLKAAVGVASLFFMAYQLGSERACDKQTVALKAKLDEIQRRVDRERRP